MVLVSLFQDIQALALSAIHFKSFQKDLSSVHINTSICQLIHTFQTLKEKEMKKEEKKEGKKMRTQSKILKY